MAFTNLHQYYYCIKRVYSIDINVFNSLPHSVKNLSDNPKQFKSTITNYLHASILQRHTFMEKEKDKLS